MSKIVGLTGFIGSGKSTVAKIFYALGVPVFSSDKVARVVQEEDMQVVHEIQGAFGKDIYDQDGRLRRASLAQIVFGCSCKLKALNAIVHPRVLTCFKDWLVRQTAPYVIKESALLFMNADYRLEHVCNILVHADREVLINRVVKRDALNREDVLRILNNQPDMEQYLPEVKFIIENNANELVPQVVDIHEKLLSSLNN